MKRVFLAGPLRAPEENELLSQLEQALLTLDVTVFLPSKAIGPIDKTAANIDILQRNFDECHSCDIAVFVLTEERSSTGIELGYLYCLRTLGLSSAVMIGFCPQVEGLDLMSRFCLSKLGHIVSSIQALIDTVSSLLTSMHGRH